MARLHEHEGKALFKIAKMPIPQGDVAKTPEEARKIAEKIGKPVVIKIQIWAGGRGKAGGVKFADTPEEAQKVLDVPPYVKEQCKVFWNEDDEEATGP